MRTKLAKLEELLAARGSVAVAYSGGVDSTFLLAVAHKTLGAQATAVTARTPLVPAREFDEAADFCTELGIRQIVLDIDQLKEIPGFVDNPRDRCYICKRALFERMADATREAGYACLVEGSNADDEHLYRPGAQALAELGIASPLAEAGLTKREIRTFSREMGLPTWDKPSSACLASRFEYGAHLDPENLVRVAEAEAQLFSLGFSQVRVRVHGEVARIEVRESEFERAMEPACRARIVDAVKKAGFTYAALDLQGFRIGSMDE